ncbi:MAG: hypothetical protein KGO02_18425 [Alphaproteobacteria bacterium]|nr:hypothetical protein [Alphaproteobacteria bacterium]
MDSDRPFKHIEPLRAVLASAGSGPGEQAMTLPGISSANGPTLAAALRRSGD